MAIRPRFVRLLLARLGFFESGVRQLAIEPIFARAAAELFRSFRYTGVTFNETQVALSTVFDARRSARRLNLLSDTGRLRVRDFSLVSAFEDVIGARTRFVIGVKVDLERFSGGALRGKEAHFELEFNSPPTFQQVRDRMAAFRTFPGERARYQRLRDLIGEELDFGAIEVEFIIRLS